MAATLGYATAGGPAADLADQLADLAASGVDSRRIFTDRAAGSADKMRPGLIALLSYARPGDAVVVVSLDRLGRSSAEVAHIVADLTGRAITVRCLASGLDTASATGRAVAEVLTELAALDTTLDSELRS
ncbi:MAG: recombinase family protein [Mycobacterium kyogaense]|uniref:recombinase family protein n=1 Tax=Mycobacterium kyogaense TaxID=2212479 RepID=UPI002FFC8D17